MDGSVAAMVPGATNEADASPDRISSVLPNGRHIVWSDRTQRADQIAVFSLWLPDALRAVDGIDWQGIPGPVMGYLVNNAHLDEWWGPPMALAAGIAAQSGNTVSTQYGQMTALHHLFKAFTAQGVGQLSVLKERSTWETLLAQHARLPTPAFHQAMNAYASLASMASVFVFEDQDGEDQTARHAWEHAILPHTPLRYLGTFRLSQRVRAEAMRKRRAAVEVLQRGKYAKVMTTCLGISNMHESNSERNRAEQPQAGCLTKDEGSWHTQINRPGAQRKDGLD